MWTGNRPGSTYFAQNKVSDSDCTYIISKHCRALCVSARKEYHKIGVGINRIGYHRWRPYDAIWRVQGSNGEGRLNFFAFQVNF